VNITVAALPTSGIAASTRPPAMSQKVNQASRGAASGVPSASTVMNGRKPQMKKVVHTSALSTPWMLRP
jgi:hypothetical protein